MRRIALVTLVTAVLLVAAAVAADASPTRTIKYLKVGETTDGQPLYIAFIQLKYMDAALAAEIFGGQALPGQNMMIYRPSASRNYGSNNRRSDGRNTGRRYGSNDMRRGHSSRSGDRY